MFISQSPLIMYLTLQNFFLLLKESFPLEQNNTKLQEYTVYHVCVCYIVSRGLREYSWKQCRPRTRHYSSCTPSHQNVCCRPTVFFLSHFYEILPTVTLWMEDDSMSRHFCDAFISRPYYTRARMPRYYYYYIIFHSCSRETFAPVNKAFKI